MTKKIKQINYKTSGFSILELATVMIIIGLIVVGIMTVRDLQRSAALRSVVTQIEGYKTIVGAFILKYDELPGDIPDAHDYWDNGTDTICGTATNCNGDGNQEIDTTQESLRSWQHLSLAGLLNKDYTGILDGGKLTINVNIPKTDIDSTGTTMSHGNFYGRSRNFIRLGKEDVNILTGAALSPQNSYEIDFKIDDGVASTGVLLAFDGSNVTVGECITGAPLDYVMLEDGRKCNVVFLLPH